MSIATGLGLLCGVLFVIACVELARAFDRHMARKREAAARKRMAEWLKDNPATVYDDLSAYVTDSILRAMK